MVGTQQVGEDARLSRIGYGFAAVSILMLVKLLIKERLITRCKYIPTHLRKTFKQNISKLIEPRFILIFKFINHVRGQAAHDREHG
jgi:hypothetical protein